MTNVLCTCLLVTNVKINTLVKLLTHFVASFKSKSFKRREKCMQEHLYKHFESEGHTEFLDDVSITPIDKTDGSNPT